MATTLPGGSSDDVIIIEEADVGKIEIVDEADSVVTEITVNSAVTNLEVGLSGDKELAIAGSSLKSPKISNEAESGETGTISLSVTKATNLEFSTSTKAATELSVPEGKLLKPTITTTKGKAEDSIQFGAASTVKSASISLGKGPDTLTFSGQLKGKTTVVSGKGSDLIEVNSLDKGNGKLILSDFSKKDTLLIGDETYTSKNSEDAPKWVKFND